MKVALVSILDRNEYDWLRFSVIEPMDYFS